MADHHDGAANHHGTVEAEHSIGNQSARERQEIDTADVPAVHPADACGVEVEDLVHVKREDRHHRVEAVTLPQLGKEEHVQAARMTVWWGGVGGISASAASL